MDSVKEPVKVPELVEASTNVTGQPSSPLAGSAKPTVVSARLRTEAESYGAKRAASRKKTAENDADLMYLSQLQLTSWKPARLKRYKPTSAFENRSILMCPTEQATLSHTAENFTMKECEELLLSKLHLEANAEKPHGEEPYKQPTLEEAIRSILLKANVIRFEKLIECLRDRFHEKQAVKASVVIPVLQRVAVLLCGWWVVKSEILYPPNTFSEHASVPNTQLIRARDYVMAVFHRGDHLTRKTVSSITKLPSLEVTEILEKLGTRISVNSKGHSNHWEFHPPDFAFIRRYPDVVHQHGTGWELRIRQLCVQLKLDRLVTDSARRRHRCSGRLSSCSSNSESEDVGTSSNGAVGVGRELSGVVVNLLSPASTVEDRSLKRRRRRRLSSLSPEVFRHIAPDKTGLSGSYVTHFFPGNPPKRARTKSMSSSPAVGDTASMAGSKRRYLSPQPNIQKSRSVTPNQLIPMPPLFNTQTSPSDSPPLITSPVPPATATVISKMGSPNPPTPLAVKSPKKSPAVSAVKVMKWPSAKAAAVKTQPPISPVVVAPTKQVTPTKGHEIMMSAGRPPTDPSAFKREPLSPPDQMEGVTVSSEAVGNSGPEHSSKHEPLPSTKVEAQQLTAPETKPTKYRMEQDPVILSFVREKLQSHPILALSELTKACQPFMASLGASVLDAAQPPPPGSEAERELLKLQLYDVAIAAGARELKVIWPDVPSALTKQPLFVAPVALEFGDASSPLHQVRNAILAGFENSSFITFGSVKRRLVDVGCEKITDNTIRSTIKRYCIFRHAKYFLRFCVAD